MEAQKRFGNGYKISVQWGPANYCDHYDETDFDAPRKADHWESRTAEIAIFDEDDSFVYLVQADVHPNVTADQVGRIIGLLSAPVVDIVAIREILGG